MRKYAHQHVDRHRLRRWIQPRTLILWGRNDIFIPSAGEMYLRDLPDADLVQFDSGHFAVEDSFDEVVGAIKRFYDERIGR